MSRDVESVIQEAEVLLARNEGFHNMHGNRAAILGWRYIASRRELRDDDWEIMDALIGAMRIYDKTKVWPK